MRLLLIITFLCINYFSVQAQKYCPPLSGKLGGIKKYHINAGFGVTKLYGDIEDKISRSTAGFLGFDYQLIKGLYIGVEGQMGALEQQWRNNTDPRRVRNEYLALGGLVTIHPVEVFSANKRAFRSDFSQNIIESFFISVGTYGVINNYENIYRNLNDLRTIGPISSYDENGDPIFDDRSKSLMLPSVAAGLAIPINKGFGMKNYVSLLIRGQFNFSNNEYLDGYVPYGNDGFAVQGKNDFYNYFSLGLRYSL